MEKKKFNNATLEVIISSSFMLMTDLVWESGGQENFDPQDPNEP